MRTRFITLAGLLLLQTGCGLNGLWAEIPPYQGPGADVGADAEPDAGTDTTPDLLDAPANLDAVGAPTGVTLSWSEVDGATGYQVRRDSGAWVDVGDTLTWEDTDAPRGAFDGVPVITASDGDYGYKVTLEVTSVPEFSSPPAATYEVRAVGGEVASASGARTVSDDEVWTWSVAQGDADLTADPELTGRAPEHVADAPGQRFRYTAALSREGVEGTAESAEVTGSGSKAIDVVTGDTHVCVLLESGSVVCWGNREDGRLGDGLPLWQEGEGVDKYGSPVKVALPEPASYIDGHMTDSTCAVGASGDVYCWGRNRYGEIGDGSTTPTSQPRVMSELQGERAVSVHVSAYFGCAVYSGETKCWGAGFPGVWEATFPAYERVFAGDDGFCGLRASGGFECYDYDGGDTAVVASEVNEIETEVGVPRYVDEYRVGVNFDDPFSYCLCFSDASDVYCLRGTACMGDPLDGNASTPEWERRLRRGSNFSVGIDHACGITDIGLMYCWGKNDFGQVGDGTQEDVLSIESVVSSLPSELHVVSASSRYSCVLNRAGLLRCWGANKGFDQGCGVLGDCTRPLINTEPGGDVQY
jgi:hypothetical protein